MAGALAENKSRPLRPCWCCSPPSCFRRRALKLRARVHWSADDPFGGARLPLWRDTLRMAASHPWLGVGPEAFVLEFPRSQSLELARAYPDFYHESPHNTVLDALVAQGVPGAILVLATWGVAGFAGVRAWKAGAALAAPLLSCAAALLVNQQFSVLILPTALACYLLQALLVSLAPAPFEAEERDVRWPATAWVGAMVLAATLFVVLATRLAVADYSLEIAQRAIGARDLTAAKAAYEAHKRWSPPGTSSDLYYSRAVAALAGSPLFGTHLEASSAAVQAGARAARYSEQRSNAWYSLATLFANQGDAASVERCLRTAIAWAPNWFKPHWTLAQVLQLSGRRDEALREAKAAVDRDGGRNPEVTATWNEYVRAASLR